MAFPISDRSEHDPTQETQTATRRAIEATFRIRREQILLKITTFPAPAIIPNFTTCCACHEKWHVNFSKCCACHEKWHMNFTKCCICYKKWHMNFTKCCTCHNKWHMNFTQMLHLPQKVTHELPPNAAPATKSDTKWHMTTTSSTAQGGGGSFKNRTRIGEIDCCEWRMSEQKHWPTD